MVMNNNAMMIPKDPVGLYAWGEKAGQLANSIHI